MESLFTAIGMGIVATVACVLLRKTRPEMALVVSLAAGIAILFILLEFLIPTLDEIQRILEFTSVPGEYAAILFKALGICFLSQFACDACKDAGESAIASKIEAVGKIAIVVVSLPLFSKVLSIVHSLI
ncbi:SpoIIIAC/SpoIIIAD family protein [Oscillospiraceae bacterium MB08-C2-2]|nr:SpoIIIAC/SpoIIIAD family protein [Oscillospiraceae bacterium MB08-C2-2]